MGDDAAFGELGDRYNEQLSRGLRLTGEGAEYYASARITRVREIAHEQDITVRAVLDFGCGTGAALALLRAAFPDARLIGFEPAVSLRALAAESARAVGAEVLDAPTLHETACADLVYCNGVFHHIPPTERIGAAAAIGRALVPGGLACIWENSPYNPGTRLVMSRIPFDKDAVLLSPNELRLLQASSGLSAVATEFHFVFPRVLRAARVLEPHLRSLPFGGQFVVVGRRG